jgi:hypothetical protein
VRFAIPGAFMAFSDPQPSSQLFAGAPSAPLPLTALTRLAELHDEACQTSQLAVFLDGAVHAAGALVLMGMAVLTFAAGTALQPCFIWAVLILLAVGTLLRSYIRSIAAAFDRPALTEAAQDLRAILFYAGSAWGAGAFLVLSPAATPATAVLFAVLPSLTLSLLLKDREGVLVFLIPVTAIGIAAAILRPWPDAGLDTALLLMLQSGIAAYVLMRGPRENVPAGLALR